MLYSQVPYCHGPFPISPAHSRMVKSNHLRFQSPHAATRCPPGCSLAAPWLLVANEVLVMRDGLMDHLRVEPVSKEPGRFNGTMVSSR